MLTKKQMQCLEFMKDCNDRGRPTPSFDEMMEALNLKSKSGVHRVVIALEERGYIRRLPHRARAIEIVRLPPSLSPPLATIVKSQQGEIDRLRLRVKHLEGVMKTAKSQIRNNRTFAAEHTLADGLGNEAAYGTRPAALASARTMGGPDE